MRLAGLLCSLFLAALIAQNASSQAVVSTHAGVVNLAEGAVFLDDQPCDQKFGTFSAMKEGSVLRTDEGRAEVLLTPGVFLRIDEHSAIRMVSNALANTRVEFLQGAAILDSNDAAAGSSPVSLTYKSFKIHFNKPGVYRLDSEPGVFQTYTGEAEIVVDGGAPQKIDESNQYFFGITMETKKYGDGTIDRFSEWARDRAETIAADNRAADQSTADPSAADPNGVIGSPFGAQPVDPSFLTPGYSVFGGPLVVDNAFWGAYNPFFPTLPLPVTVIYVFPRWYGRTPVSGTLPHRTGYPILPPSRSSYPLPYPLRPTPITARTTLVSPVSRRVSIASPRPAIIHPMSVAPVIHR